MSFSDLPLPSKVICYCDKHKAEQKQQQHLPDPRLTNWDKWIEERERVNNAAAKALDRQTEELLVNYSEDRRAINEDKTVFENSKIIYPHDHYRGNPAFFRLPDALQKKPCQPDYFSVMSNAQKCEMPSMEYVDVPTGIRQEKGTLTSGYRNEKRVWDASNYKSQRTGELREEIKVVQPYKPDLSELFIKGTAIERNKEDIAEDIPVKYDVASDTISERSSFALIESSSNIHSNEDYLKIGNSKLCNHVDGDVNVYLTFEYDLGSHNLLSKSLEVVNGTSYALRYSLIPHKKFNLFRDIIEQSEEQVFYYDKRELVMLPNQTFDLEFNFSTDFPSTYTQQLIVRTRPKLWNYSLVINLVGIAIYHDLSMKCAKIKERIDSGACKDVVQDTIHDILGGIPTEEGKNEPTFYIYDKAIIFQAVNQKFSPITRHPKYVYNKEIVDELEAFYLKVRLPDSSPTWNLNIEDLRVLTKKKQEVNYQKRIVDEMVSIKSMEDTKKQFGLSASKDRSSVFASRLSVKSGKSIKSSVSVQEHKTGENLLAELEDILSKLQQFTTWSNENKNLYESCYSLICTAFDIILKEISQVEIDLNISNCVKYPLQINCDPHAFEGRIEEIHQDLPGQSPRIIKDFIKDAKPIAECLKNLSFEESEARYKSYYGIVDEVIDQKQKGKGKGKNEKADKKPKKEKSKSSLKKLIKNASNEKRLSKQEIADFKVDSAFDIDQVPSTDVLLTVPSFKQSSSEDDLSSELTSQLLVKEYKRSLYDIFYRNLLEATVKLVDVIELHKRDKLRLANIKRMIEETTLKQPPIQMRVVDLKEAIRLAMDLPVKYRAVYSDIYQKPEPKPSKFGESVELKSEGSEWSILKPMKVAEPFVKPISHPESNLYLKKKMSKRMFKDVGTVMSNAGIDPDWMDFKDVGAQIISKWENRADKEEFFSKMIGEVVDEICIEEATAQVGEGEEEDEGITSKSSEEVFYDEELLDVPDKNSGKVIKG